MLRVAQDENCVTLRNASVKDYEEIWQNFFDMGTDYAEIKEKLKTDEVIIHAAEAGSGIRILRQELWECLISFIVSQNNNIPRIKKDNRSALRNNNYGEKRRFLTGRSFTLSPLRKGLQRRLLPNLRRWERVTETSIFRLRQEVWHREKWI